MRPMVVGMVEPGRPGVVVVLLVPVDVLVSIFSDEHDRSVHVHVVVAMMQRVQPRQDGQRGAERAEDQTSRVSPAPHLATGSLEHIPDFADVTISRRRRARTFIR